MNKRVASVICAWLCVAISPARAAESAAISPGFDRAEAAQMLELSTELNGNGVDDSLPADTGAWKLIGEGSDKYNAKGEQGFGPFNNRWKLWQRADGSNEYAIVVRGTILSATSITEDLMANTLKAQYIVVPIAEGKFISYPLASRAYHHGDEAQKDTPVAEVHAGFAYGLTAILFDREHGLVKPLLKLPAGSRIFVTGHSQGAAIATLLHAFMHYACADRHADEVRADRPEGCPKMGLEKMNFSLKSYVFAQPKPGNWRFAMDFAQAVGQRGYSYTIDNYDDPVVQVPVALQMLSDSLTDQEAQAILHGHYFGRGVLSVAEWLYKGASWAADKRELEKTFLEGKEHYAAKLDTDFANAIGKSEEEQVGRSLNYVPVGNVVSVRPRKADNLPERAEKMKSDVLWEHHLWRYKQLSKYWP